MRILTTFPGRAGDLLWALPTVRAISEHFSVPVDLHIAGEFHGMVPLLQQQTYLGAVSARAEWGLTPPEEWQPPAHPGYALERYDRVYHLGYRGWPVHALPFETQATLEGLWNSDDGKVRCITLDRPWITVDAVGVPCTVAVGFTECWFELKFGLLMALESHLDQPLLVLTPAGSRWTQETGGFAVTYPCGWLEAARVIRNSTLFLGDCSALHVLAVALGKPCVLMEPMESRHNAIFYPLGTHSRVRLVRGNDGLPTTDARHTADVLKEVLHANMP